MNKLIYTDGEMTKSFDRAMSFPDEAWSYADKDELKDNDLYARVAAVFRAANLSADVLASLPFALVQKNGDDYDTSQDWQNKLGFMPNPRELLRLWRLSLFITNTAYGFMEDNPNVLRYIVPGSIEILQRKVYPFDMMGFKRTVGGESREYPIEDKRTKIDKIIYFFRRDHTVEQLPSKNTEFRACMAAAGVLYYSDYYMNKFLARGGVKPSMLLVKGTLPEEERNKIEKVWDRLVRNYYKYRGKIFNADAFDVKTLGDGLQDVGSKEVYESNLADIAMAAGMPLSLLLANSANYATAQTEYAAWFRDSVEPWSNFIAGVLTDQVFSKLGLKFEFRPDMTDPGQESEVKRAMAFKTYVDAGLKKSLVASMLGLDLPNDMMYEDLDDTEEVQEVEETQPEIQEEPEPVRMFTPTIEQSEAMVFWHDLCNRKMKRGEPVDFDFKNDVLPQQVKNVIKSKLSAAKNAEDIRDAFNVDVSVDFIKSQPDPAILELAKSINKAAENVSKTNL